MFAGVVTGLMNLAGLKYLPARNSISHLQNLFGLPKASDVTNMVVQGPPGMKTRVELHRMDARIAEDLVCKWQKIKSDAFGPNHSVAKLPEVLCGQMLKTWADRAAEIAELGWVYDYTLLYLTSDSVTLSQDGKHAWMEAAI